jgi:hypothetical protein
MGSWELRKKTARVAFEQSWPAWIGAGNHVSDLSDPASNVRNPRSEEASKRSNCFLARTGFYAYNIDAYES